MAKEKKIKSLTLAEMKKQDKVLSETKEEFITINDTVYKVEIDVHFRQSKRNKVLDDLIKFFEAGRNDEKLYSIATPYTSLLMVKHFTSLEVPDDIEEALDYLQLLLDLGILGTIVNAMPDDQIVDLYEKLTETINEISENMSKSVAEANEILEGIENPEVRALMENGKTK
ncbi:hypothetical protein PQE72_gp218 [Bacillus phage vB_BanS_Skywalker]|uniref:Uncharacterized protein n=2 Tax=Tsamsavirus TaxID=3044849 RepID=A0AAE9CDY2_9CAUD|nr:hypothetical protein PQE72_gp218 [Bacillus phage vB_BanS_Skywalker]YP_010681097.1 hypothetical protein PQE73_gp201 [Bacillus phage vB_BanS_MrDarsey]UGO48033.1 hypothetical protein MRDARSEY_201 [Bacillus phage vB_BanS_MrDarsey]UGO51225.1 hypothetical protein SKYWALKER_68 [Bacillus phage vB_BanS_Skywalker]